MANNIIKIKRSTGNSAPSSLSAGELAFTGGAGTQGNNGQRVFIGDPANSNAVTVVGGNYFTNLMDHVHGTTTASSVLIVDANKSNSELRTAALHLGTSGSDTLVTSTAAELNKLDGTTATVASLTYGKDLFDTGVTAAEFDILDGITLTTTELNIIDGDNSAVSTTLIAADRIVTNDAGVMKQVALSDYTTFFSSSLTTVPNVTSVGTLTALQVDNVNINGNTVSTTNTNGDLTIAPNGSGNVAMTTDTLSVSYTHLTLPTTP